MRNLNCVENTLINTPYLTVSILGKVLKLDVKYKNTTKIELNKTNTKLELILPRQYKHVDNTNIINSAIQKMYDKIAITEIDNAMELVRYLLKFAPEDYKIDRLKNVWYKYSNNEILTINPDIVKYNEETIITTLIQAFCRSKFNPNSNKYKEQVKIGLMKYEAYKNKQENNNIYHAG